jgi:hypothetical protein
MSLTGCVVWPTDVLRLTTSTNMPFNHDVFRQDSPCHSVVAIVNSSHGGVATDLGSHWITIEINLDDNVVVVFDSLANNQSNQPLLKAVYQ